MNASIGFFLCFLLGTTFGYNVQRDFGYNNIPNELYSVGVGPNFAPEYSQRLFWGNQGSNQVGGTGLWATLTNKFPFLATMFGRMELPTQYGAPNQYEVSNQYGAPNQYEVLNQYGAPGRFQPQYFRSQQFAPSGRDVGLTDDAVIVTPPHVPIAPLPAPAPVPVPVPSPVPAPLPPQEPSSGYEYNKPQYRLQLPRT